MRELIKWDDIARTLHVNVNIETTPPDGGTMLFLYEFAEKENLEIIAFASDGIIVRTMFRMNP